MCICLVFIVGDVCLVVNFVLILFLIVMRRFIFKKVLGGSIVSKNGFLVLKSVMV